MGGDRLSLLYAGLFPSSRSYQQLAYIYIYTLFQYRYQYLPYYSFEPGREAPGHLAVVSLTRRSSVLPRRSPGGSRGDACWKYPGCAWVQYPALRLATPGGEGWPLDPGPRPGGLDLGPLRGGIPEALGIRQVAGLGHASLWKAQRGKGSGIASPYIVSVMKT